jgi:hypothetical protein
MTVLEDPVYYACIKCRREFSGDQITIFNGVPKHLLEKPGNEMDEWHIVEVREDH